MGTAVEDITEARKTRMDTSWKHVVKLLKIVQLCGIYVPKLFEKQWKRHAAIVYCALMNIYVWTDPLKLTIDVFALSKTIGSDFFYNLMVITYKLGLAIMFIVFSVKMKKMCDIYDIYKEIGQPHPPGF